MSTGLIAAAALAGAVGSPHCVAMCGAACAGLGGTRARAAAFQAGRLVGYALLGAMAAGLAGGLQWMANHAAPLKPLWAMFHVAAIVLGASLIRLGAQPAWLDRGAQAAWRALRVRTLGLDPARWPALAGALWALLPCGLLYSALMLAALADGPLHGAAVMAAFAATSGGGLQFGASLWRRWGLNGGRMGVRVSGAALAAGSAWALFRGVWPGLAERCG
ncbi:sulfite exporter TauE/SafE family protein [Aquabacterium sp. J223]|uniref:sulfite exporter TauE/SafE family protein n=1 Tax=Aquabacterium sp. J223 TaxID=2898431 RepID=UPI0021AD8E59|nr:sulfite exporter TauE/SafE family protein [Aquabacterium sp. J223]UUX95023.1 sulfite exporter TauE/SafE family protein [Aquabacterium sp. J223]